MKLKTYHSESVEAAVRLAGVELGDEAIFLGSREKPDGEGDNGYEVTFAVMEAAAITPETEVESQAVGEAQSSAASLTAEHSAAPRDVVDAPARSAAAAVGAAQASPSSPSGASRKIERPHWKKYVPEDLEVSLKRAAIRGGSSEEQDPQTGGSDGTDTPTSVNAPPAPTEKNVAAPATVRDFAGPAASQSADASTSEPASIGGGAPAAPSVLSVLGLSVPASVPPGSPGAATAVKLAPEPAPPRPAPAALPASSGIDSAAPSLAAARLRSPSLASVHEELSEIRRLLKGRRFAPWSSSLLRGSASLDPFLANQHSRLTQNGVDPLLIFQLISHFVPVAGAVQEGGQDGNRESRFQSALESLCNTSAELGDRDAAMKVCAFVGPSGAGKTSSVVKLAVHHGWQRGERIHLISLDQQRLGAAQQLQAYARVAEIPITTVEDVSELRPVLDRLQAAEERPELVFIDTSSYAPSEKEGAAEAAQAVASRPDIEPHLVLSLTASQMDHQKAVDWYGEFGPTKLLFTKLDECSAPGNILNGSVYAQLPVSFISRGPAVPEDIRPASPAYLAELMLQDPPAS